jgi:hypothetical protein
MAVISKIAAVASATLFFAGGAHGNAEILTNGEILLADYLFLPSTTLLTFLQVSFMRTPTPTVSPSPRPVSYSFYQLFILVYF